MDWHKELNPAQLEAVTQGDGPVLVIAGAGTGKTRTLACRVAHLIHQGVPPERILLLTFTRRAAAEMINRAEVMTGRGIARRVWGGTFHATANRLLRQYGRAIGLEPTFTVMDQGDAAELMNLVRTELGLGGKEKRFPHKETLVSIYSLVVNAGKPLAEVIDKRFPWCRDRHEQVAAVFDRYTQRKRANSVVDYDDLLLFWRSLCDVPGIGRQIEERFDHILVDEYQDTNSLQAGILLALRQSNRNIMVVGDDAQAIYSFRAATIRNILDFPKQFPEARQVTLEQNYRSTQPILAVANAVIAKARERFTKNLWSHRQSSQKPVLFTCQDDSEQADLVCQRILTHHEEGTPLHEQAVLFRAGYHSAKLEIELAHRNIPFRKYGGLKFVESAHIKDLLAFLRILQNPYDELSWFRVLRLLEGIGQARAARILESIGVHRRPALESSIHDQVEQPSAEEWSEAEPPDAPTQQASPRCDTPLLRLIANPDVFPPAARKQALLLCAALKDCMATAPPTEDWQAEDEPTVTGGPAVASQVERLFQFYAPILEQKHDDAEIRKRDIEQLVEIAARYRSRERFIVDMTLDAPASTSDLAGRPLLDEDYLILSTIHSAKGCEWDVVHVIHAADGIIPSDMALTDHEGLEEERRLFYVALTRARDMLYIYFPLRYYHTRSPMGDAHSYAQLTRFLPPSSRAMLEPRRLTSALQDDRRGLRRLEDLDDRLKALWRPPQNP